jgi:hypothetical protein
MADKDFDPEDPMGLVAVGVDDGDLDLQATCLVEEFVRMGMSDAQLLAIFRSPFYAGAHAIWRARGDTWVQALVGRVRDQWGQPRFTVRERGPVAGEEA